MVDIVWKRLGNANVNFDPMALSFLAFLTQTSLFLFFALSLSLSLFPHHQSINSLQPLLFVVLLLSTFSWLNPFFLFLSYQSNHSFLLFILLRKTETQIKPSSVRAIPQKYPLRPPRHHSQAGRHTSILILLHQLHQESLINRALRKQTSPS